MRTYQKIIFWLFAILLFLVPLILWPTTSELFEFNKMVVVYILTTLITSACIIRSLIAKKFIFRRTILDIPLLVFLGSQLISTLLSIDPTSSWLGYYSRFNGGLLSSVCYSLLYWAFVSNLDKKDVSNLINFSILPSAALVSIYGVLEHFGIDKTLWVQDVQSRVFSTLGQPNWLAAWLGALLPITWAEAISNFQFPISNEFSKPKFYKFLTYFLLSILFFWTIIFTKSRSGLAGLAVAFVVFWAIYFWRNFKSKGSILPFAVISSSLFVISLISGTQYTPSLASLINKSANTQTANVQPAGTALETGGTESGTIRKIVWKGAVQVWLHYPIFGSGVETFAFSYYLFRPPEHNLTSEWDFVYNKAHNEYLNFMANSGTVGILAYLALIGFAIAIMGKGGIRYSLLAGFAGLLVTNFFGFSVVPTQLEFFLFPAFAFALSVEPEPKTEKEKYKKIEDKTKYAIFFIIAVSIFIIYQIGKYWDADRLFSYGGTYNSIAKPDLAVKFIIPAVNLEPNQPIFLGGESGKPGLAYSYVNLAMSAFQNKQASEAQTMAQNAIDTIDRAISLSPANVNFKRTKFGIFVMLSSLNPNFLINARDTLIETITQAPTDAKLFYNLGLTYSRTGQDDLAIQTLKKTVELKSNYTEARLALAILLISKKENNEARTQLEYILKYLDPENSLAKQTLESIK